MKANWLSFRIWNEYKLPRAFVCGFTQGTSIWRALFLPVSDFRLLLETQTSVKNDNEQASRQIESDCKENGNEEGSEMREY